MNKEDAQRRLKVIELEAKRLQEVINAPEKPELRHGEVVVSPTTALTERMTYLAIDKEGSPKQVNIWGRRQNGESYINGSVDKTDIYYETIGINIFDLLKEWSEDLVEFTVLAEDNFTAYIKKLKPGIISMRLGNSWYEFDFKLSESEEIWRNLGQLIAHLKRKEAE